MLSITSRFPSNPVKKLATPGKRYVKRNGKRKCVPKGIIVPRAALTNDHVYGKIKVPIGKKDLKYLFNNPETIVDDNIRTAVLNLLKKDDGNVSKILKQLKKSPFVVNGRTIDQTVCYEEKFVFKYPFNSITKQSNINSIVDLSIRRKFQKRFDEVGEKDFVKSLIEDRICSDVNGKCVIRNVRCFARVTEDSIVCTKKDSSGRKIGFSQKQNNHYLNFYKKTDGKIIEFIISFWDGIMFKRYGIPTNATDPATIWEMIANMEIEPELQEIISKLPPHDSMLVMSLKKNDMVVLGMSEDEWNDAIESHNHVAINNHLYRVGPFSSKDYNFKFHTDTSAKIADGDKKMKMFYRVRSAENFFALNPHKINISLLGEIDFDNLS